MDGVDLIVSALASGGGAVLAQTANIATQEAYAGLKQLLVGRFGGREQASVALAANEREPGVWRERLGTDLAESGAAADAAVLAAARRLLEMLDPAGARAGTFNVTTSYGSVGPVAGNITINQGQPLPPTSPTA